MRGGGGWGGCTLMMHCLGELCETEYDRLSDFEDSEVCAAWEHVCACREMAGLCVRNYVCVLMYA